MIRIIVLAACCIAGSQCEASPWGSIVKAGKMAREARQARKAAEAAKTAEQARKAAEAAKTAEQASKVASDAKKIEQIGKANELSGETVAVADNTGSGLAQKGMVAAHAVRKGQEVQKKSGNDEDGRNKASKPEDLIGSILSVVAFMFGGGAAWIYLRRRIKSK